MVLLAARIAGALVALAVVATGALGVTGGFLERREILASSLTATRLVITTDGGDVTVRPGPAGQPIRVVRTLRWSLHRPVTSVGPKPGAGEPAGTTLVSGSCPAGLVLGDCSVDVDVTMPPATDLEITSALGDVDVDGAAAALAISADVGDITVTGSRTPSPTLDTSVGDISADFVAVPDAVRARAGAGDVRIALPPGPAYLVRAKTELGDPTVTVDTAATSSHVIDASSQAGDVTVVTR